MKKYFATAVMAMVMVVMLAIPVYAQGDGCGRGHGHSEGENTGPPYGHAWGHDKKKGDVEQGQKQKQQQGQIQGQLQGQVQTAHNEGVSQETIQVVVIENPDEIKVNSQLTPMAGQQVDTIEYHGETLEDHKYQDEILEFLLAAEGPKPFKVRERGFFTRKSSHSDSKDLSVKEYEETTTVYVFRDIADLEANIESYSIVGYADTFSKGKASLMDCFDQAVIDSGEMGGNIVVILDIGYINALKSTTTGLGGSGATTFFLLVKQ